MGDLVIALISALVGALLSLGGVAATQGWNARAARREERAAWAGEILDGFLIEELSSITAHGPGAENFRRSLAQVPAVPYVLDTKHRGQMSVARHRLKITVGRIYEGLLKYEMASKPLPDGYLDYEEVIRDDLDAWVHGKKKARDLFVDVKV